MKPLTHHEILTLVGPFAATGRRVDLAGSDREKRELAFQPVRHHRAAVLDHRGAIPDRMATALDHGESVRHDQTAGPHDRASLTQDRAALRPEQVGGRPDQTAGRPDRPHEGPDRPPKGPDRPPEGPDRPQGRPESFTETLRLTLPRPGRVHLVRTLEASLGQGPDSDEVLAARAEVWADSVDQAWRTVAAFPLTAHFAEEGDRLVAFSYALEPLAAASASPRDGPDGAVAASHRDGAVGATATAFPRDGVGAPATAPVATSGPPAANSPSATPPTPPEHRLVQAEARIGARSVVLDASRTPGMPADLRLTAHPDGDTEFPDDLVAVLGRAWRPLLSTDQGWKTTVKLPRREPGRSEVARERFLQTVAHLDRCWAGTPAHFHRRFRRQRWNVFRRRTIWMQIGAVSVIILVWMFQQEEIAGGGILPLWVNSVPLLLLIGVFFFWSWDVPLLEFPPIPREPRTEGWSQG